MRPFTHDHLHAYTSADVYDIQLFTSCMVYVGAPLPCMADGLKLFNSRITYQPSHASIPTKRAYLRICDHNSSI